MIEIQAVTRKWGNSIGVILPKEVLEKEKIKEDEKITVLIVKKQKTFEAFRGLLKGKVTESAQKIKDDLRKELYDD